VVWQGSVGDRRPYADLVGITETKTESRPRLDHISNHSHTFLQTTDPLMQAAIRRVTFGVGFGPGLLSFRIVLHAIDLVNEVCGAEPLAHPYL
jgi:hypothetical protein